MRTPLLECADAHFHQNYQNFVTRQEKCIPGRLRAGDRPPPPHRMPGFRFQFLREMGEADILHVLRPSDPSLENFDPDTEVLMVNVGTDTDDFNQYNRALGEYQRLPLPKKIWPGAYFLGSIGETFRGGGLIFGFLLNQPWRVLFLGVFRCCRECCKPHINNQLLIFWFLKTGCLYLGVIRGIC